jgi:hypothetical protein
MIARWKARCFPLGLAGFADTVDRPDGRATLRRFEETWPGCECENSKTAEDIPDWFVRVVLPLPPLQPGICAIAREIVAIPACYWLRKW